MNIFQWIELQYRNLFMLPSKDGKRRLVKNWFSGQLKWTKGESNKPTTSKDFEVPENIEKIIEDYPTKGLTVTITDVTSMNTPPGTRMDVTNGNPK